MSADEGCQPVADDDFIYRRIPLSKGWYDPATHTLSPEAFNPLKFDTTGLSFSLAKLTTIEQASQGPSKEGYYVATLRVGDLRKQGMDVVSKPMDGNPGHAEIPVLNYVNKKSDQVKEWKVLLAHVLTLRVEGPFIPASN